MGQTAGSDQSGAGGGTRRVESRQRRLGNVCVCVCVKCVSCVLVLINREVSKIRNVDVGVNAEVEPHPVGCTHPKILVFCSCS